MDKKENNDINPDDLPQNEVFKKKEVFQHPQPADWGEPLGAPKPNKDADDVNGQHNKEEEKSSKHEGLNEEKSPGKAGAFEGFEDLE